MADRIIVLGPKQSRDGRWECDYIEIDSAEASALVQSKACRITLTRYSGLLANSLVLVYGLEWFDALKREMGAQDDAVVHAEWWRRVRRLVGLNVLTEGTVETPIPTFGGG